MAVRRIEILEKSTDRLRVGPKRWSWLAEWITGAGWYPFVSLSFSVLLWYGGPRLLSVVFFLFSCLTMIIIFAESTARIDTRLIIDRGSSQLFIAQQAWFGGPASCSTYALADLTGVKVVPQDIAVSYPDYGCEDPIYVFDVGVSLRSGEMVLVGWRNEQAEETIEIAGIIAEFLGLPSDGVSVDVVV